MTELEERRKGGPVIDVYPAPGALVSRECNPARYFIMPQLQLN
jgi:hypothetical protein